MADSIDGQLLKKTQAGIQSLAGTIEDISLEEKVVILQVAKEKGQKIPALPFIPIWLFNTEIINEAEGSNSGDIIVYPIGVAVIDKKITIENSFEAFDRRLFWRQKMMDHFIPNRVTISPDVVTDIFVVPGQRIDKAAWENRNIFVNWFVIQYRTSQQRRA